jgi:DNA ligase-1
MKPMLAKKYDSGIDPTGWFMSEKLDGVRAIYYNGVFTSRNEKLFVSPPGFDAGYPRGVMLDGELWIGRGRFNETSGQVRRKTDQDWSEMQYMVFDAPQIPTIFEQRLRELLNLPSAPTLSIVEQVQCQGRDHLAKYEAAIVALGGEGVMLHHPCSCYLKGKRSPNVLKVKRFCNDEATVIGYQAGQGKHEGRLGALICGYKGKRIFLGTGFTDAQRDNPPPKGTRVTFKYFEMSDGIPRFPVFVGVRDYE